MTYTPPVVVPGTNNGPPVKGRFHTKMMSLDGLGRQWICTAGGLDTAATWKVVNRFAVVTDDDDLSNPALGDLILNKS